MVTNVGAASNNSANLVKKMSLNEPITPKKIVKQVAGDIVAAMGVAAMVSIPVTLIDVPIVKATIAQRPVLEVFNKFKAEAIKSPSILRKPGGYIAGMYLGTYITNNLLKTVENNVEKSSLFGTIKVGLTTAVNTLLSVRVAVAFTQMYGGAPSVNYPPLAKSFFYGRDFAAMAVAFTVPSIASQYLINNSTYCAERIKETETAAQLISPVVSQIGITFIHLCGIAFSKPEVDSAEKAIKIIAQAYKGALVLRMVRAGAAYGIGGVVNKEIRALFNT